MHAGVQYPPVPFCKVLHSRYLLFLKLFEKFIFLKQIRIDILKEDMQLFELLKFKKIIGDKLIDFLLFCQRGEYHQYNPVFSHKIVHFIEKFLNDFVSFFTAFKLYIPQLKRLREVRRIENDSVKFSFYIPEQIRPYEFDFWVFDIFIAIVNYPFLHINSQD